MLVYQRVPRWSKPSHLRLAPRTWCLAMRLDKPHTTGCDDVHLDLHGQPQHYHYIYIYYYIILYTVHTICPSFNIVRTILKHTSYSSRLWFNGVCVIPWFTLKFQRPKESSMIFRLGGSSHLVSLVKTPVISGLTLLVRQKQGFRRPQKTIIHQNPSSQGIP